jgi:hypothetical protein
MLRYSFNKLQWFMSIAQRRKIAETILDSAFRHSSNWAELNLNKHYIRG